MLKFCNFIATSLRSNLEDMGHGQKSLHMTHPLMLMIISAKFNMERNPPESRCYKGSQVDGQTGGIRLPNFVVAV